ALRQGHFVAPGAARLPAVLVQQVGGGGQRVGYRVPDVAPAVAVDVDGIGLVAGGNELGVAHSARPRSLQVALVDVAALQDLQGGDELGAGELGALLVGIGQRRQRA